MTPSFRARSRITETPALSWLLLSLSLPACTSWHVGTPTPAQFVDTERPEHLRVTRTDGSTLDLGSPVVLGDSLMGTDGGGRVREDTSRTVGVALSDVRSVAVKKTSVRNTVLIVGVVALTVSWVALAIECSDETGPSAVGCP